MASEIIARMLAQAGPSGEPGADTAFDPFLSMQEDSLGRLVGLVEPDLDATRARAPDQRQRGLQRQLIGLVAANSFRARMARRACHYPRGKMHFVGGLGQPDWLRSKPLIAVVDRLSQAGYLITRTARPGPTSPLRSTFEASAKLATAFEAAGLSPAALDYNLDTRPALEIRDDAKRPMVLDTSDERVRAIEERVRRYNRLIQPFRLSVGGSAIPFSPSYRVFSRGSLDLGGRFYGGAVQALSAEQRKRLLIDGAAVVELDFSGFMVRALYHLEGVEFTGDPYDIPALKRLGPDWGLSAEESREEIKTMCLVALNARSRNHLPLSNHDLKGFGRRKDNYRWIEEFHAPIAQWLYAEPALRLMKLESDICDLILQAGVDEGVPVYQVHDGFIVPDGHHQWLSDTMIASYRSVIGGDPIIKRVTSL